MVIFLEVAFSGDKAEAFICSEIFCVENSKS